MRKNTIIAFAAAFVVLFPIGCSTEDSNPQNWSPTDPNPPAGQAVHFTSVSGQGHTLAIRPDGTLWVCGNNANGELGNGTSYSGFVPPAQLGTSSNWKSVDAAEAGFHSMAIKTDGSLWAWGTSHSKAMGIGDVLTTLDPVRVGIDNDWKSIDCCGQFSLAIKNNGTLWGSGSGTGLGIGISPMVTVMSQIGTDTWKTVSAGLGHGLGIKTDGTLWSWGFNNNGQLGNGTQTTVYAITQVGTANDWKQISASGSRSMAIKNDGSLWAWGQNNYGQLGLGNTNAVLVPTRVGSGNNWKVIKTSNIDSYAVKTDGSLWGWGFFTYIGMFATEEESYAPVRLHAGNDWDTVFKGNVLYARKNNGEIWVWGASAVVGDDEQSNQQLGVIRPLIWE